MNALFVVNLLLIGCNSVSITVDDGAEWETILQWNSTNCPPYPANGTGSDNPNNSPRAFITGDNKTIEFLSSSSWGFYQRRGKSFSGLKSVCDKPVIVTGDRAPNATPNEYWNQVWVQSTWRDRYNASIVYAIIHNEFHAESQVNKTLCPSGVEDNCWYANGLCSVSYDGGNTFKLYDLPERDCIGTPFKYVPDGGRQSLSSFSNMISNNGYIYVFVNRGVENGYKNGPCLYRIYEKNISDPTQWRAYNSKTNKFDISNILDPYIDTNKNPNDHICSIIPTLTTGFRWGWTYNNILNMYVQLGFNNGNGKVSYSVSKDMLHWSEPQIIMTVNNTMGKQYTYPVILDETSKGVNFEFSNANPYLYIAKGYPGINRDIVRIRLKVTP
eukprot:131137_1